MNEKQKGLTKTQIKREIIQFLDDTCGLPDHKPGRYSCGIVHRNCLVLATSKNDVPRATPLEFFNEGLNIYIIGEPGGKIANLRKNPKVSAAIYEQPLDHSKKQKSLQLFGRAELIPMKNNPRLFKAKARKFHFLSSVDKMIESREKAAPLSEKAKKALKENILTSLSLIKITPESAVLREYDPDFSSSRYTWKK